ncbi:hypothetical protein BDR05DRAFT_221530 [Suillus weaverae]|nr:hypothetical protein BDR05DRAFT_221530 [Suillus weaverae]
MKTRTSQISQGRSLGMERERTVEFEEKFDGRSVYVCSGRLNNVYVPALAFIQMPILCVRMLALCKEYCLNGETHLEVTEVVPLASQESVFLQGTNLQGLRAVARRGRDVPPHLDEIVVEPSEIIPWEHRHFFRTDS